MEKATSVKEKRLGAATRPEALGGDSEPGVGTNRLRKTVAMKVYLLAYDEDMDEESLLRFLDARKQILDWMAILPASVLLISSHSPRQLTKVLNKKYPDAQFVLTEVETTQTDGMLPKECWDFINSSEE